MPKNNKPLTLTLQPLFVGKSFPAIWVGQFNRLPDDGEGDANKAKIRKIMNDDLADKIAKGKATPGFKLQYDWKEIPGDARRTFLKVTAKRPNGAGPLAQETPPTPKSPAPPPQ